jgi:succinoglycan biosynthesis transport protein ExoP
MDFWRVVEVLNHRKYFIILSVVATVILTYGATRLIGAKFTSTVTLITPTESSYMRSNNDTGGGDYGQMAMAKASDQALLYESMAKSRDVIEPAIKSLKDFNLSPGLLDRITVQATNPHMFLLSVTESDYMTSMNLANAIAKSLVEYNRSVSTKEVKGNIALLKSQLSDMDAKITALRVSYNAYCVQHHITGSLTNTIEMILSRLKVLQLAKDQANDEYAGLQAQLKAKETQLNSLPPTVPSDPTGNYMVSQLRDALSKANIDLTLLQARYNEKHPLVQQALSARNALQERLNQAIANQAHPNAADSIMVSNPVRDQVAQDIIGLKQASQGALAQVQSVERSIANTRKDLNKYNGVDSSLASLTGEIADDNALRSGIQSRLNNARQSMDIIQRQNPLTIMSKVDDFNPPINAAGSRNKKLLVVAFLSAFLISSGIVVALDSIDRRIRSAKEVESVLPGRVLAVIPQSTESLSYEALARATELNPKSLQSEAYRFLGMHLLMDHGKSVNSLMVLSAKPEQGSTTIVTNLGITLAQAGKSVILVDANIRTAEMHYAFNMENEYGFSDLLRDASYESMDRALKSTGIPNLWIVTSGETPDNPWSLLRSPNLYKVSEMLHQRADFVIYDTPSASIFTDALNLAPVVDAAFLCVRAFEPLSGMEERLIALLAEANVNILGNVINDVPLTMMTGYKSYQRYYPANDASNTHHLAMPARNGTQGASEDGVSIVLPSNDIESD